MMQQNTNHSRTLQQYQSNDERELNALRAVKDVIAPGCTDAELRVFLAACQRTGLDPFARQIYAIKRGNKLTIQTAIDGYRAIAEGSGKYGGQTAPEWCDENGEWVDVWLKKGTPAAARVGVIRTDFREIVWGIARFDAYKQESNSIWQKMPDVMIAKCAEALALRKAFPKQMGGVYTREEMEQAEYEQPGAVIETTATVTPLAEPEPEIENVTPLRTPTAPTAPTPAKINPSALKARANQLGRAKTSKEWGDLFTEYKANLQGLSDYLDAYEASQRPAVPEENIEFEFALEGLPVSGMH